MLSLIFILCFRQRRGLERKILHQPSPIVRKCCKSYSLKLQLARSFAEEEKSIFIIYCLTLNLFYFLGTTYYFVGLGLFSKFNCAGFSSGNSKTRTFLASRFEKHLSSITSLLSYFRGRQRCNRKFLMFYLF